MDRLNTIFNPLKFKARAAVDWNLQPFRTRLAVTHVGTYTNNAMTPAEGVSSYTPVDLSRLPGISAVRMQALPGQRS